VQSRVELPRQSQSLIAREEAQRQVGINPMITKISNRSNVYDYRKNSSRAYFMGDHGMQAVKQNNIPSSSQLKQQLSYLRDNPRPLGLNKPPLTPIKENEGASIVNLPPPSSHLGDPDNNILFLDNGNRI
jgi:hypothetical protein